MELVTLGEDARQDLEALGYVGRAATTNHDVLPDPKTRVHSLAQIRRAYQLFADDDLVSGGFELALHANQIRNL